MDALAIADALAARYAPGTITPPTGYPAMRVATARIPNHIPTSPWTLVVLRTGEMVGGSGVASFTLEYHVLFHYAKHTGDSARDMAAMAAWIGPLLLAVAGQYQLGLGVTEQVKDAHPTNFVLEVFTHGGAEYYGWDITVEVTLRDVPVTFTP